MRILSRSGRGNVQGTGARLFAYASWLSLLFLSAAPIASAQMFTQTIDIPGIPPASANYALSAWADFDNDGDLDIAIANESFSAGFPATLYRNDGPAGDSWQLAVAQILNTEQFSGLTWADYNNDGRLDLILAGANSYVMMNTDSGLVEKTELPTNDYANAAWGDFDLDGDPDLLVVSRINRNQETQLYRNDAGTFISIPRSVTGFPQSAGWADWADYDNDGDPDILFGGSGNDAYLYANENAALRQLEVALPRVENSAVAWGDYNNDGLLDFVYTGDPDITSSTGTRTEIFRNNGGMPSHENFKSEGSKGVSNTESAHTAWADFNNDGRLDLLIGNARSGNRGVFRNDGDSFSRVDVTLPAAYSAQWGDFNGDSRLDMLVGGKIFLADPDSIPANTPPSAPADLRYFASGKTVFLDWKAAADDMTPAEALSYNVRVGTSPGGGDILSPAAMPDGRLKMYGRGNTDLLPRKILQHLEPGEYFWTVQSIDNGYLGSVFAGEQKFRIGLALASTGAATALGSDSAVVSARINTVGFGEAKVLFQFGRGTAYGDSSVAVEFLNTDSSFVTVSDTLTGLSPGSEYHYRVIARNRFGAAGGDDAVFTTQPAAPLAITSPATGITSVSATLQGLVNPHGLSTSVRFEYGLSRSYGSEVTPLASPYSGADTVFASAAITGLQPNQSYHFRLVATNAEGMAAGENSSFITPLPAYPDTLNLRRILAFPRLADAKDYTARDYRLIGLPGASNASVKDFLAGQQGENWQVYWDNGEPTSSNRYLVKFDAGSDFQFQTGRGFWVVHMGDINIADRPVPAAPLDENLAATLPLHGGWNIIANPFDSPISWNKIQATNGNFTEPLWSFDGDFRQSIEFDPYAGYYFDNTDLGKKSLKVPYSLLFSAAAVPAPAAGVEWRVQVALVSEDGRQATAEFGVAAAAAGGRDDFDFRRPRGVGELAAVTFRHPEWDAQAPDFATDIRPAIGAMQEWRFQVRHVSTAGRSLLFRGLRRVPSQFKIVLIDRNLDRRLDLRADSVYALQPAGDIFEFAVLVGSAQAMAEPGLGFSPPLSFSIGPNYPNPFNPETVIPVAVPRATRLRLAVFNLLGREISTLAETDVAAGYHYFLWNGTDNTGRRVPSGIYYYRLIAGNRTTLLGKMLLLQ